MDLTTTKLLWTTPRHLGRCSGRLRRWSRRLGRWTGRRLSTTRSCRSPCGPWASRPCGPVAPVGRSPTGPFLFPVQSCGDCSVGSSSDSLDCSTSGGRRLSYTIPPLWKSSAPHHSRMISSGSLWFSIFLFFKSFKTKILSDLGDYTQLRSPQSFLER